MDGLSVAASIAGLVSLADTVFTRTYRYAKALKNATKEINELAVGIRDLSSLLHGLNLVLSELEEEDHGMTDLKLSEFRLHYVSSCLSTLTKIQKRLDKHRPNDEGRPSAKNLFQKLGWPFSVSETKEILVDIEKHKASITIAITGDTLATVLKALSRQDELITEFENMKGQQTERWMREDNIRMDKERKDILTFFGKIDPSSNHKMSLQLRHPMTGLWFTEGLTFRTWLETRNSKLWLSGIPGAGKTVIAASIIGEAMKKCEQGQTVAYFYCDYKDTEKQNPANILGSLASQIARQNEKAFSRLEGLYRTCCPKDKPACNPEAVQLATIIREMSSDFDDISIIIDGLDECGSQATKVVEVLVGLASKTKSNIRTLFLSRDESEIRELLSDDYSHLEIAAHSEDLRLYVATEIEARQRKVGRERLRIRGTKLKEDMMRVLVERADGMFRWVACQLDYLCSLGNDEEKRKALDSLPPGLNQTYERILDRVNQGSDSIQRMVQKTLQWTVSPVEPLSTSALCHAISIKEGDRTLNEEAFYDEEDILMHCSSLLRRSATGEGLEMAHFTVKEFLSALDPDSHSPYSRYSQKKAFVYPQLAITCLSYVTLDCYNSKVIESRALWWQQEFYEYPFRVHAAQNWHSYARNDIKLPQIWVLIKRLFDPTAPTCFLSWAGEFYCYTNCDFDGLPIGEFTNSLCIGLKPLHMAAMLGLKEICSWLIESGCDANAQSLMGTPLHCTLLGLNLFWETTNNPFWFEGQCAFENGQGDVELGRLDVLNILVSNNPDYNILYQDRFGHKVSCAYLAYLSDIGLGEEHPLITLVTGGAHLDEQLLARMREDCEYVAEDQEFIDALIRGLQKSNQEQSVILQAGLNFNSPRSLELLTSESSVTDNTTIEQLIDMLYFAVKFDHTHVVAKLIHDPRLNISRKYESMDKPFLHEAVSRKSVSALRLLLSLGVDANSTNEQDGQPPLYYAVDGEYNELSRQCTILLLDHGANVNAIDRAGQTTWHFLAGCKNNTDMMCFLLETCGEMTPGLNFIDKNGLTPMFIAARRGQDSTCRALLSHDAYRHQRCPEGLSLVHYAAKMSSMDILQALQRMGYLLTEKTIDGRNGLHFISSGVTPELVQIFIDSGVDINCQASNGETPLHILACLWPVPSADVLGALFDMFTTEIVINLPTIKSLTPLHYTLNPPDTLMKGAHPYDLTKHLEALIARGADVHMRFLNLPTSAQAPTPLMLAASCAGPVYVQILIDHGANVRAKDYNGWEAAHYAALHGHVGVIKTLLAYIIDWDHCINDFGCNILHLAAAYGSTGLVEFILQEALIKDLNLRTSRQDSALHLAAHGGHHEIVRLLIEARAEINDGTQGGQRPLHIAALSGNIDIVRELLKHNCYMGPDKSGMTPLLSALRNGHQEVSNVLKEFESKGVYPSADLDGSIVPLQPSEHKEHEAKPSLLKHLKYAIEVDDLTLCRALVEETDNIHDKFSCGCTPLLWSLAQGRTDITRYLVDKGASYEGRLCAKETLGGYSSLHLACMRTENLDFLEEILTKSPSTVSAAFGSPVTPLHVAVAVNNTSALTILLQHWDQHYADNSLEDGSIGSKPAIISGCQSSESHPNYSQINTKSQRREVLSIYNAQIQGSKLRTKWVLPQAAKPDTTTFCMGTPLHLAASCGRLEAARLLLHYGATIDSVDEQGNTPLSNSSARGQLPITQLLLKHGANPANRECSGGNPAMLAAQNGHVEILELLTNAHTDLVTSSGQNILHIATSGGPQIFAYLLLQGSDPHIRDVERRTPVENALWQHDSFPSFSSLIFNSDLDCGTWKSVFSHSLHVWSDCCKAMVKFYLKKTPHQAIIQELEATTRENESVLGEVAQHGCVSIARLLIDAGADLELDRGLNGTPLLNACAYGRLEIVKYLVRSGAKIIGTKQGKPFSATEAAQNFPNIVQWLLVGRYTEQLKITLSPGEDREVRAWAGIHCVRVNIVGLYTPLPEASSLDYAKLLAELRNELRGQVVQPLIGEVKD